jgi:cytochrome c-type biogenesis protein CcmH/NrfF
MSGMTVALLVLMSAGSLEPAAEGVRPGPGQVGEPTGQAVDSTADHPEARSAIDGLWSPYCPGMMLEVCPSPGGAMLRSSIDSLARSGLDADSIVELVLAEYGEEYRAEPLSEGVGGLAWYVPPAVLVAGLIVVGTFLARRRGLGAFSWQARAPPTTEEEARLREAMAQLDADERPDF